MRFRAHEVVDFDDETIASAQRGTTAPRARLVYVRNVSPRLSKPPIVEVVCGFHFAPLAGIDPVAVGKYWAAHKEHEGYTGRQILPAISDRVGLVFNEGTGPLRSLLLHRSDDFLLQIQADRFYFNWRKRAGKYPHFSDTLGTPGVMTRSLEELASFSRFCATDPTVGAAPRLERVELAKIDLLESPTHWRDHTDLCTLLPLVGALPAITDEPTLDLSLVGRRDGFEVAFSVTNAIVAASLSAAVKIETRIIGSATDDPSNVFRGMNRVANEIFFGIINPGMHDRFGDLVPPGKPAAQAPAGKSLSSAGVETERRAAPEERAAEAYLCS